MTFSRATLSDQERVTLTAGVSNRAGGSRQRARDARDRRTPDREALGDRRSDASGSALFAPFTLAETALRGTVRAGSDPLAADNTFHFVLPPSEPLSVLLVDEGDRATRAST